MATDEQALEQAPTQHAALETELDEASIMSSLARLQELHISLRNMRGTIPKVMDSVLLHSVSPDQLHSNFSQAANAAAEAIKRFTQMVEDGKTREIIEKARERRTENSEGITGWQVAEHEDWLDVKQEDGKEEIDKEDEVVADASEGSSGKDMTAALDRFRSVHVGIEVSQDEDSKKMTVALPLPARINFQIQPSTNSEGRNVYSVDCKGKSGLYRAILEAVRARIRTHDLDEILDMLASYSDIKSRPCVKCSRLLDRNAQFPIIRSRTRSQQPDGRHVSEWLALHTKCA